MVFLWSVREPGITLHSWFVNYQSFNKEVNNNWSIIISALDINYVVWLIKVKRRHYRTRKKKHSRFLRASMLLWTIQASSKTSFKSVFRDISWLFYVFHLAFHAARKIILVPNGNRQPLQRDSPTKTTFATR